MRSSTSWPMVVAALVMLAGSAAADGGEVVLRESHEDWIVTLLAQPTPLRAGPASFSVLVQDRDGAPVVDTRVGITLSGPGLHHPLRSEAMPEAGNLLFRETRVHLAQAGSWRVEVEVTAAGQGAVLATELEVAEPLGKMRRHWLGIALGPLGVLVIALHQARVLWRPRASRHKSELPSGR